MDSMIEIGGNSSANSTYAFIPVGITKPGADSSQERHSKSIRSANIGVSLCLKCCGVHRSLGTYISKVSSVTLDDWSDEEIESMIKVGGNFSVNSIYEASIPDGSQSLEQIQVMNNVPSLSGPEESRPAKHTR
ncbi:hypothetical protein MKX03_017713 [Papaver bracteatum]|nr:hypothetical protein MKX03_017713 [Papaver bracteatum]